MQGTCGALADDPSAIGHIDADTTLSRRTWQAALAGVGACCHAIDQVMAGKVRVPCWLLHFSPESQYNVPESVSACCRPRMPSVQSGRLDIMQALSVLCLRPTIRRAARASAFSITLQSLAPMRSMSTDTEVVHREGPSSILPTIVFFSAKFARWITLMNAWTESRRFEC